MALVSPPLIAARRWPRPKATLAPERFARLRRLSLAPLYLVLARRPAFAPVSVLRFVVSPLSL